ncbi:MAG: response regulator transcription factor [Chitinophagales bacterium]
MEQQVIIADDHPIFRMGVREILNGMPDIKVVAEAANGLEAYQCILANRPQLAILDLEMPMLGGLEVARKVKKEKNQTAIIILTMHRERSFFDEAMNSGVNGYLLKDNASDDLVQCVRDVLHGRIFVSPAIHNFLHAYTGPQHEAVQRVKEKLTATENVILKLIAEGKTSQQIAALLFISANTVDNHRANMAKKLQLEGKNALLKFAMQLQGA